MDDEPFRHCDLESILKDPSAQPYDLRLQYLRDITDDFSTERELGRGGFGVVYKGILPNGKMIAVKNLVSSSEVQQKQFKNEVDNLMRVRHQNIVQFVGYCYETWLKYTDYNGKHIFAERPKRLLCFEYMPKGSLDRYISDESSGLDWPSRYKIIKGICCGLHYLHEECQTNASVIHLDLKPANILLDDNMEPKIADFGLSKFFDDQKVQTCATTIAGSHGYMAPEYIWDHIITTKADIYSLGVIIIEMITGRRIGPFCITVTSCQDFVEPVLGKWRNRFEETPRHASPELECQQIESCLQIGLSCIKIDRMERPTTKEIIEKLHRWESTNCYASNEENSHKDKIVPTPKELLEISPLELRFSLEINKRIPCIVKLTNKTDDYVAFYFGLMMAKKNYYIEPTSGFLWPRSTFNVVVTMEEQQELQLGWQCSDEFLIQSIAVEKYMLTSKPITADLFDNMSSNLVNKVKLTVVYVPPAELPSASHTGSEARFSSLTSSSNLDSIKISYPQRLEDFPGAHGNEDEDMDHAIALSLSEEDQRKGKAIDTGHHLDEDEQLARALQENTGHDLDEDEQLARALQESMNDGPPRQEIPIEDVHSESAPASGLPSNIFPTSGLRVCAGCKSPIGRGRFFSCMDSVWHPECFRCYACDRPISEYEFAVHENHAYHRPCYKECFHPKCDVCSSFIPTNKNGLIEYQAHPFWMQKYCPSHENDGTPRCCSCERMEPKDSQYITLDDGRRLCLECLHTAIMETNECQPLYIDIQEFYEGMNMKVEQQVPLLLVERQALNEAMEAEKSVHHLPETRGLCLSEEQIVRTILKRPIIGPGNRIIDMITGPHKLIRRCEVTAILILYGLPRLLTGSILAHEMMHAFLRLKGYRTLSPEVEEGICQVLAHLWLESEITSGSGSMAATSDASSSSSSTSSSSKKGAKTEFEKRLGEFFKYQIETDSSVAYGDGFRAGMRAVERYGLRSTLDHIKMTGSFPY